MTEPDRGYLDIRLRPVADADLDVLFEQQREPSATRMAAATAESREPFLDYWAEIRGDPAVVARTITVGGQVAGHLMCWHRWGQDQVGYWIGARYWGRGVATTALGLFLSQVMTRPLHAYVARHNTRSIRVLEKCRFRPVPDQPDRSALAEYILDDLTPPAAA